MKRQVAIIGTVLVAGVSVPLALQQRTQSKLAAVNAALDEQKQENARLAAEVARLSAQPKTQITTKAAATTNATDTETLRLRGEVGRLRQDAS